MRKKIAHLTDLHLEEACSLQNGISVKGRLKNILKDIEKESISEIVCTGDIGEGKGISYFFEQFKNTSLSITLGNHDSFTEVSKHYNTGAYDHAQKLYSSAEKEGFKFIYLDSSEGIIDQKQLLWLKGEIFSSKPIIIFLHHPIIGLKLKVDKIGRLRERNEIIHLLENCFKKITIFCGHYHLESTTIYKNITQYITPAVSFQMIKNTNKIEIDTATYGYRIIELEKGKVYSKTKLFTDAN